MVRDDLQAEMLRLQAELNKTVIFVTHDIDEAVKLGDGSRCSARASPPAVRRAERLLSNPANDFVSAFVGADRGYRGLQFQRRQRPAAFGPSRSTKIRSTP